LARNGEGAAMSDYQIRRGARQPVSASSITPVAQHAPMSEDDIFGDDCAAAPTATPAPLAPVRTRVRGAAPTTAKPPPSPEQRDGLHPRTSTPALTAQDAPDDDRDDKLYPDIPTYVLRKSGEPMDVRKAFHRLLIYQQVRRHWCPYLTHNGMDMLMYVVDNTVGYGEVEVIKAHSVMEHGARWSGRVNMKSRSITYALRELEGRGLIYTEGTQKGVRITINLNAPLRFNPHNPPPLPRQKR
jgi:hypothetical protein